MLPYVVCLIVGFISTEQFRIQSVLASDKTDWRLSHWGCAVMWTVVVVGLKLRGYSLLWTFPKCTNYRTNLSPSPTRLKTSTEKMLLSYSSRPCSTMTVLNKTYNQHHKCMTKFGKDRIDSFQQCKMNINPYSSVKFVDFENRLDNHLIKEVVLLFMLHYEYYLCLFHCDSYLWCRHKW